MRVVWVGNKAQLASNKHFGGALTEAQMTMLVKKVIMNRTHVGESDRANAGHTVAKIVWGEYNNTLFSVVMDGDKVKKGIVEVVSFYDVHNAEVKAERFGMKKV